MSPRPVPGREDVAVAKLPTVGSPAPSFDLPRADGGRLALSDLRGKPALLFFFPKASTPG